MRMGLQIAHKMESVGHFYWQTIGFQSDQKKPNLSN